jgi:hypothetical protein
LANNQATRLEFSFKINQLALAESIIVKKIDFLPFKIQMVEYQGHFRDSIHYPLVGKHLNLKRVGHLIYSNVKLECFLLFSMWRKDKLHKFFSLSTLVLSLSLNFTSQATS